MARGGATDEQEIDGSWSKNGPRRQTGYLWNAESKVYKMGINWSAGSTVKRNEINF
jgi:hypothetical protein